MQRATFVIVVLLGIWICNLEAKKLPSFVERCKRNDPKLSECVKKSMLNFKKYLPKGVKELRLVPMDPYELERATLDASWMKAEFTNLKLYNSFDFEVDYINVDLDNNNIAVNLTQPYMEMKSHYKLAGQFLQFGLNGEGEIQANYTNTKTSSIMKGTKVEKKGQEYLELKDIDFRVTNEALEYFYLHDLFPNNPELTERVNSLFAENRMIFGYSAVNGKELPSFVKKCKRDDPGLNDCVKNALIEFKKYLPDGVEEMKLPPLNPYVLPEANIATPWMNTTLMNLKLYNSYDYVLDYFDINLNEGIIKLNTTVDHMEMNSRYEIDGKILQFTLHGEGEMEGKVNNTKVGIILSGKKIQRKGKEYLILEKIDYKLLEPPKAYMYFHDLFRNNPEITERVNMVIQENQEELFKDIYPLVEKIVSTIDLSLFKGVFDNFSLDELFD
ncbi:hypothetical protein Trydic_g500 [Trypoxylus dichotomus]